MEIVIDVETVPSTNRDVLAEVVPPRSSVEEISASIRPPGNIKKPESIKTWMDENHDTELNRRIDESERARDEALRKTALNTLVAEIITIGYAIDDGPVEVLQRYAGDTESDLLARFKSVLPSRYKEITPKVICIGFNHVAFDLPLLHNRAAVHGMKLPLPRFVKPWDSSVFDVMDKLGGRISQHLACRAFGLPSKTDLSGDKIYDAWRAGEYDRIAAYCAEDVGNIRELYRRIR